MSFVLYNIRLLVVLRLANIVMRMKFKSANNFVGSTRSAVSGQGHSIATPCALEGLGFSSRRTPTTTSTINSIPVRLTSDRAIIIFYPKIGRTVRKTRSEDD